MKHKALDLILIVVLIIGGFFAWQTGRERSRLRNEYARLSRKTGDLRISDPSLVHVKAIETNEPLNFAWRVYLPPNYKVVLRTGWNNVSRSWSSGAHEFIARVRFREDDQGVLQVYSRFFGGSSQLSLGDRALADLLRGRWDKIKVEQLGAADLVAVEPDQPAVLLKSTLPDEMHAEARKALAPIGQEDHVPVLFTMELGPKTSKP